MNSRPPQVERFTIITYEECPHCDVPTGQFPRIFPWVRLERLTCPTCQGPIVNAFAKDRGLYWEKAE
jgi:hypothetical protein